ncbi:hypothetical protein H4R18_001439 [Coemansia javaensis]|uniref:Anti-proliferative protein domain-containing protein n=1 Tax=Coemansia javaensis TaxID=2761396 RepID=A0A9W8LJ62_9FUNG|nr:hypothetical protein H4R18_001439 [Coemansia javaensis]
MQTEVENAANFWLKYIPEGSLAGDKREALRQSLIEGLHAKYEGHWHVERATAGSAYRSISNWHGLDGVLAAAARRAGVGVEVLERWLPRDVIVWCDPYSVSYRVGDHGGVIPVFEDKRALLESVKRSVAEKVSRPGSDFVISAYTTPVVIRSADGVEISRRGGTPTAGSAGPVASPSAAAAAAAAAHASPTKGANDIRRSAMSPLRQVSTLRPSVTDAPPPRWTMPSS